MRAGCVQIAADFRLQIREVVEQLGIVGPKLDCMFIIALGLSTQAGFLLDRRQTRGGPPVGGRQLSCLFEHRHRFRQIVSGLVLREEGEVVILADAQGKEVRVTKSTIDERNLSPLSPMPANLVEQISEPDFYHLMGYLLSLRPTKEAKLGQ